MMDEFALLKGHRYAKVVVDYDSHLLLWVREGRSRTALRPFFIWMGPEGCTAIESVSIEMNAKLDLEVRVCQQIERLCEQNITSATYRLYTSVLEHLKNQIKAQKRMAHMDTGITKTSS